MVNSCQNCKLENAFLNLKVNFPKSLTLNESPSHRQLGSGQGARGRGQVKGQEGGSLGRVPSLKYPKLEKRR